MKKTILIAALLAAGGACADELRIPVKGEGWTLTLDGPPFDAVRNAPPQPGRSYIGSSGPFNVSLMVNEQECGGDSTPENMYKCFGSRMQTNPYIIGSTIRAQRAGDGMKVMYVMEIYNNDRPVRLFNVNYLFAHKGKWADLHLSVVQPQKEDLDKLLRMADTVKLVDGEK